MLSTSYCCKSDVDDVAKIFYRVNSVRRRSSGRNCLKKNIFFTKFQICELKKKKKKWKFRSVNVDQWIFLICISLHSLRRGEGRIFNIFYFCRRNRWNKNSFKNCVAKWFFKNKICLILTSNYFLHG